jgi:hypothetical protein
MLAYNCVIYYFNYLQMIESVEEDIQIAFPKKVLIKNLSPQLSIDNKIKKIPGKTNLSIQHGLLYLIEWNMTPQPKSYIKCNDYDCL